MSEQTVPKEWLTEKTTMEEIVATCAHPDPQIAAVAKHYLTQATGFVDQMQPGDELWNYSTPDSFWASNQGDAGLAIVRDDEIVESVCMVRN